MKTEYLVGRILQTGLVVLLVSMATFFFLSVLPGDPVTVLISPENAATMTIDDIERARERLGLNRPIAVQYLDWLGGTVTGDWGVSTRTGEPVRDALMKRAPVTLTLALFASALSLLIAIPAGIVAGIKRNSWFDRLATLWALAGVAMPNIWLGLLLILFFAVRLDLLPPSGYVSLATDPVEGIKRMILPAIVLGTAESATIMRQTRSSMLEVLSQDYVRTARAKGLRNRTVIIRHALRNALIPVTTILGLRIGNILGGAVIVETIFALPGMGRLAVQGIFAQDFPVTMAFVLLVAFVVAIANLITDITYALIDPRIQLGRRAAGAA